MSSATSDAGASGQGDPYQRYADTLSRTEWLSRVALEVYQHQLLERLVRYARANSPFYAKRLSPVFDTKDGMDFEAWSELPLLTRDDLKQQAPSVDTGLVPADIGEVIPIVTSGTTGAALSFKTCAISRMAEACMMHRLYRWHGFDLTASMASIRPYRSQQHQYPGTLGNQWSYPGPEAPHHILNLDTDPDRWIAWLLEHKPAYLLTLPSVAHEIANHALAPAVAALNLRAIVSISEITAPDVRALVSRNLGVEMYQIYGCSEVGGIAMQETADGQCLICEESTLVEIVGDDNRPVGPGETGRVVLTGLYNYATPFIRYEVGDYATAAIEPSPTGRTLKRIMRVEGRRRNSLLTHSGRRLWESDVLKLGITSLVPTGLFHIHQQSSSELVLSVVSDRSDREIDMPALQRFCCAAIGPDVNVTLRTLHRPLRAGSGKRERIVSSI